jgi:Coenzyme PQQ synthesis protein D (PqqD)
MERGLNCYIVGVSDKLKARARQCSQQSSPLEKIWNIIQSTQYVGPLVKHNVNISCIVERSSDVVYAEAGNDIVMVKISRGYYYGVSDVALYIWNKIEMPTRVSDIIDSLVDEYDVNRELCERETLVYIDELLVEGLIQVRDEPSA